jgi:hypothetical protein
MVVATASATTTTTISVITAATATAANSSARSISLNVRRNQGVPGQAAVASSPAHLKKIAAGGGAVAWNAAVSRLSHRPRLPHVADALTHIRRQYCWHAAFVHWAGRRVARRSAKCCGPKKKKEAGQPR